VQFPLAVIYCLVFGKNVSEGSRGVLASVPWVMQQHKELILVVAALSQSAKASTLLFVLF
jgi:hypothetical protein